MDQSPVNLALVSEDIAKPMVLEGVPYPVVVHPPGWCVSSLPALANVEHKQLVPNIAEEVTVTDNASFLSYLKEFDHGRTLFAANRSAKTISARLDYHSNSQAWYNQHRLVRSFKRDARFADWINGAGKWLDQKTFAEFLQDRVPDFYSGPDAPINQAGLLTAVMQFRATQNLTCNSAVNLHNGDIQLQYIKDTVKQEFKLPELICLELPVYEFCASYKLHGRLKFELVEGGKVRFRYDLIRLSNLEEVAFLDEVEAMQVPIADTYKAKILLLS